MLFLYFSLETFNPATLPHRYLKFIFGQLKNFPVSLPPPIREELTNFIPRFQINRKFNSFFAAVKTSKYLYPTFTLETK